MLQLLFKQKQLEVEENLFTGNLISLNFEKLNTTHPRFYKDQFKMNMKEEIMS
jgi:hypothetical protein